MGQLQHILRRIAVAGITALLVVAAHLLLWPAQVPPPALIARPVATPRPPILELRAARLSIHTTVFSDALKEVARVYGVAMRTADDAWAPMDWGPAHVDLDLHDVALGQVLDILFRYDVQASYNWGGNHFSGFLKLETGADDSILVTVVPDPVGDSTEKLRLYDLRPFADFHFPVESGWSFAPGGGWVAQDYLHFGRSAADVVTERIEGDLRQSIAGRFAVRCGDEEDRRNRNTLALFAWFIHLSTWGKVLP